MQDHHHPGQDATMIDWPNILQEHGPAVWRTVYHLIGDTHAAHDCYQETFLAAMQHARRKPVENWSAFLQTIAARRAMDHLRQRYRARRLIQPAVDPDNRPDNGSAVGHELQLAEIRQQVRAVLSTLAPRQAQAFWMRYMQQMSLEQIARQLGTPQGNVSVLINRARARLQEALRGVDSPLGSTR